MRDVKWKPRFIIGAKFDAPVDISDGGIGLVLGADNASAIRTDATIKQGRFGFAHYTNAEEPMAAFAGEANATQNVLRIGGGWATLNAATHVILYTGATSTTTAGTERMRIDNSGRIGMGTSSFGTVHRLVVNPYVTIDNLATVQMTSVASDRKVLVLQAFTAQSGNIMEVQSSAGSVYSKFNSIGELRVPQLAIGSDPITGRSLYISKSWDFAAAESNFGIYNVVQDNSTVTNAHYLRASFYQINSYIGAGISNTGYMRAFQSEVYHRGDGTQAEMAGAYLSVGTYNGGSDSLGTITALYGLRITNVKTTSSTIGTSYGLYIEPLQGTTRYSIYQSGTTDYNYFGGSLLLGNTGTPVGRLDIWDGNIGFVIGADSAALTRTNSTTKSGRLGFAHYTNAEEPGTALFLQSSSTQGIVNVGGGSATMNAATQIGLYTAANNTTTTGTERLRINSGGQVLVGSGAIATAYGQLDVSHGGTTLTLGADSAATSRTDATNKIARFGTAHYTNAEEVVAAIYASNTGAVNQLIFGGGTGLMNAVTRMDWYSAADTVTTTGTLRGTLINADWAFGLNSGLVGIGKQTPTIKLHVSDVTGGSLTLARLESTAAASSTNYILMDFTLNRTTGGLTRAASIGARLRDIGDASYLGDMTFNIAVINAPSEQMRLTNSGLLIGRTGATPSGRLDVVDGGIGFMVGGDTGALTRTDATTKQGRIVLPHYTNAEEPVALIYGASASGQNLIVIGGSDSSMNAANEIRFYTGATITTLTGTQRLVINNSGLIGLATGTFGTNNRLLVNPYVTVDNLATVHITPTAATNKNLVLQGFTAQSASIFEAQSSAGAVFVGITSGGKLGIGAVAVTTPLAALDVADGNMTAVFGAEGGAQTRTNASQKIARLGFNHYLTAEEPMAFVRGISDAGQNAIEIGGGTSSTNAATEISLWTAANTTTVTGTKRVSLIGDVLLVSGLVDMTRFAYAKSTNAAATGAVTVDFNNSNDHQLTMTGNVTLTISNPPASGKVGKMTLYLKQDGTGGRTITWPGSVIWSAGTAPTLTTTAGKTDVIVLTTFDAGTTYYGFVAGQNF